MNRNLDSEIEAETACDPEPMALAGALKSIKRLNRNTTLVATGLVGSVIFAALMVALQEPHHESADVSKAATHFQDVDGSERRSIGKVTSRRATTVDQAFTQFSPQMNLFSRVQAAASPSTPDLAVAASYPPIPNDQDAGRVTEVKVARARFRSSVRPRIVGVKARLVALWHQSLVRNERSRRWVLFANSNKWAKRKVSYTMKTNN